MSRPFNIQWIERCAACKVQAGRVFCGLDEARQQRFDALTQLMFCPEGAVIFLEEDLPRGIHIVCSGNVKLSSTNSEGRGAIMGLAEPGDILGARAVLMNNRYDLTAETLEPSQVRFLRREDFLGFLADNGDVCLRLARELSAELYRAYEQMRSLALKAPSTERMVHLLLSLAQSHGRDTPDGICLGIELSREELGQMIGASRETASRILAALERKKIVKSEAGRITVLDSARLRREYAGGHTALRNQMI